MRANADWARASHRAGGLEANKFWLGLLTLRAQSGAEALTSEELDAD